MMLQRACGNAHRHKKCLKTPQPSQAPKHGERMFLPSCSLQQLVQLPGIHMYFSRGYQCRKFGDTAWSSLVLEYSGYEEILKLPVLLSPFSCSLCGWQNHRIIQAGRDSGIMQGNPRFCGLLVQCFDFPSCEKQKKIQIPNPNFLHANLHPLLLLLSPCTSQKSPIQILICPTFRQCSRSKKAKTGTLTAVLMLGLPKS